MSKRTIIFDLDGTVPGTDPYNSSVLKTLYSNKVETAIDEKAILNALGRLKKSATTVGRDLASPEDGSPGIKEWPLTMKVNKEAGYELTLGHKVPYKEWVLNRLRTNQRAPIKAQDKEGNPVLVGKGFNNTITFTVGDQVEEIPTAVQETTTEQAKATREGLINEQAEELASGYDVENFNLPLKDKNQRDLFSESEEYYVGLMDSLADVEQGSKEW